MQPEGITPNTGGPITQSGKFRWKQLAIAVVAIAVLFATGGYFLGTSGTSQNAGKAASQSSVPTVALNTISTTPPSSVDENVKTYTSEQSGFSFSYQEAKFNLTEETNSIIGDASEEDLKEGYHRETALAYCMKKSTEDDEGVAPECYDNTVLEVFVHENKLKYSLEEWIKKSVSRPDYTHEMYKNYQKTLSREKFLGKGAIIITLNNIGPIVSENGDVIRQYPLVSTRDITLLHNGRIYRLVYHYKHHLKSAEQDIDQVVESFKFIN